MCVCVFVCLNSLCVYVLCVGSTAGAGSGEFHVYRQLRRREQARQGYMRHQTMVEEADQKFEEKRAAIQAQEVPIGLLVHCWS